MSGAMKADSSAGPRMLLLDLFFGLCICCLLVDSTNTVSEDKPKPPENITAVLLKDKIIPDVIVDIPETHIDMEYNPHVFINFGNFLDPEEVYWRTFAIDWFCYRETMFTFLLTGPDEPTRENPTEKEFLYWMMVNIPIDAVICGDCLVEYIPPRPKQGTGRHRYVFLALQHPNGKKIKFREPHLPNTSIAERKLWSTKNFVRRYDMKVHAVNYFVSEWVDPSLTTKSPLKK